MPHVYSSSISRKQFAIISPILEAVRKKTKLLIYMMFFVAVLKSGCQWRMCHEYFRIWSQTPDNKTPSILEQKLVGRVRQNNKRKVAFA